LNLAGETVLHTGRLDRAADQATVGVATGATATRCVFARLIAQRAVIGATPVVCSALIWRATAATGRGRGAVAVIAALSADAGATVTGATAFLFAERAIFSVGRRAADAVGAGRGEMADVRWRADRTGDADAINAGVVD
jgi:hypothetical protein